MQAGAWKARTKMKWTIKLWTEWTRVTLSLNVITNNLGGMICGMPPHTAGPCVNVMSVSCMANVWWW